MTGGYAERAAWYAIETSHVTEPRMLELLLRRRARVVEVPAGVGHFLDAYARNQVDVTLLDAEPAMIAMVAKRTENMQLAAKLAVHRLGADRYQDAFDVVVCPNVAFNYLMSTVGLANAVKGLADLVADGGALLLHLVMDHGAGRLDRCGCYEPNKPHGTWFTEWVRSDPAGGELTRRRRQVRRGNEIRVEFEYRDGKRSLGLAAISLTIPDLDAMHVAFAAEGLLVVDWRTGGVEPSEIVYRRRRTVAGR